MSEDTQTSSVFGNTPAPDQGDGGASAPAELNEYVGEGKKFNTVADFTKGYMNAQDHIKLIEAENAELREKAKEAATVEDLMSKLETSEKQGPQTGGSNISLDDVRGVVTSTLEDRFKQVEYNNNFNKVEQSMKEKFGDKYEEVAVNRAAELGISNADMKQMAEQRPNVFLELFNNVTPEARPQTTTGTQTSVPKSGAETLSSYSAWKQKLREDGRTDFNHMEYKEIMRLASENPAFMDS